MRFQEVISQVAALNKKRTEKIPEELEVAKQRELIHELENARAGITAFSKAKKGTRLHTVLTRLNGPNWMRLCRECETAKQKYKLCIDAEIAALNRPELRYEKENLQKRQAEIKRELTRDRL